MAPIAVVVLLPAALYMEPDVFNLVVALGRRHKFMWVLLFVNSTMAYGANLCNFLVTKHTSALTLQVQSIFTIHMKYLKDYTFTIKVASWILVNHAFVACDFITTSKITTSSKLITPSKRALTGLN